MLDTIAFIVIVLIIVGLGVYMVIIYNSLIRLRNGVENAWSHVEVELERRADLIGNLVSTVKGYAKHEKTTLEEVTEARSNLSNAETVQENEQANNMLTSTLKSLFAVAENYPNLKADESFKELMNQLSETEDMIAKYRQIYNDVVNSYNNECQMFPSNAVAYYFRFNEAEFFCTEANKAPEVDFDSLT
jgi:LemA protein